MLRGALLVLVTWATLAAARVAPQDYSFELLLASGNIDSRYSTDVYEDAQLDVPDLIRKYRYPVEVHHVTTRDGYILEMHRIPHGRDQNNVPDKNKPVIFIMHGLLVSSAVWVFTGPDFGLAYILAEQGYDVWLGNARGNMYSRRHVTLDPDAKRRNTFWNFSWDEIGHSDLPAMIDYALDHTGKKGLHYIGHSQGTTAFFVMGSLRPEYNEKIISMQALAPVAYMEYNSMPLLQLISRYANDIERVASLLGIGEILPNNDIFGAAGHAFCREDSPTHLICRSILFMMDRMNEQKNMTLTPIILGHCPAGASVRQLVHYGQGISGKEFRRYDYGNWIANRRAYGTNRPPHYELGKITAPVFLHYTVNDVFAHVNDVDKLFNELARPIGKFRVPLATFSHADFMWAIDVKELVYNRVINLMAAMDANVAEDIDIDSY